VNGTAESTEVVTNFLVNNITNVMLLIGLPTILWGARWGELPQSAALAEREAQRSARVDLLLTLTAVFVFTGVAWLLAHDGQFDFEDGFVLVGMFLFWQAYHLFDLLRTIVATRKSSFWLFVLDLVLLAIGSYAVYISTDWLTGWVAWRGEVMDLRR
jgi:cation:H+ antiporter